MSNALCTEASARKRRDEKNTDLPLESRELHRQPQLLAFAPTINAFVADGTQADLEPTRHILRVEKNRQGTYLGCAFALHQSWSVEIE